MTFDECASAYIAAHRGSWKSAKHAAQWETTIAAYVICTATFVVERAARGQGIGRALVIHCLDSAKASGYRAIQFNQVVSTNCAALLLYRSLGFTEVGCIPEAFKHERLGFVPAYVMYRALR